MNLERRFKALKLRKCGASYDAINSLRFDQNDKSSLYSATLFSDQLPTTGWTGVNLLWKTKTDGHL